LEVNSPSFVASDELCTSLEPSIALHSASQVAQAGAQPGGGFSPPQLSKHCTVILKFAETFKE